MLKVEDTTSYSCSMPEQEKIPCNLGLQCAGSISGRFKFICLQKNSSFRVLDWSWSWIVICNVAYTDQSSWKGQFK